jgi:hypothetical protein
MPRLLWLLIGAGLVLNAQLTAFLVEGAYLLSGPLLWLRHRARP